MKLLMSLGFHGDLQENTCDAHSKHSDDDEEVEMEMGDYHVERWSIKNVRERLP